MKTWHNFLTALLKKSMYFLWLVNLFYILEPIYPLYIDNSKKVNLESKDILSLKINRVNSELQATLTPLSLLRVTRVTLLHLDATHRSVSIAYLSTHRQVIWLLQVIPTSIAKQRKLSTTSASIFRKRSSMEGYLRTFQRCLA